MPSCTQCVLARPERARLTAMMSVCWAMSDVRLESATDRRPKCESVCEDAVCRESRKFGELQQMRRERRENGCTSAASAVSLERSRSLTTCRDMSAIVSRSCKEGQSVSKLARTATSSNGRTVVAPLTPRLRATTAPRASSSMPSRDAALRSTEALRRAASDRASLSSLLEWSTDARMLCAGRTLVRSQWGRNEAHARAARGSPDGRTSSAADASAS